MKHNVFVWQYIALQFLATNVTAQTYRQHGVVRMITTSAASPVTPVGGVKVAVGNNMSKPTGSNGQFTMNVTRQFQVNGVLPSDEYVLALPTKGKTYYQSPNDLEVVVTTKAQKEADYKRLYSELKRKYRQQTRELDDMRQEYKDRLEELNETDTEYVKTRIKLDSLQQLYLNCVNNEEKLNQGIRNIANELSLTDFRTLDTLAQRIYILKSQGEWASISDLIDKTMEGDPAEFIRKRQENKKLADKIQKDANDELADAFSLMETIIESFKMRRLYQNASDYYHILVNAAPDNWGYLVAAGVFEWKYRADYVSAIDYLERAATLSLSDSLLAKSYNNIGGVLFYMGEYDKCINYNTKALDIQTRLLGECHQDVAISLCNISEAYYRQSEYTLNNDGYYKAYEYSEKAMNIFLTLSREENPGLSSVITFDDSNLHFGYYSIDPRFKDLDLKLEALFSQRDGSDNGNAEIETSDRYNNLGRTFSHQAYLYAALLFYTKALEIRLQMLSPNHPALAESYRNIGEIYYYRMGMAEDEMADYQKKQKEYANKADKYYNMALDINRYLYGENHPDVAEDYCCLGNLYYEFAFKMEETDSDNKLETIACYAKAVDYYNKALEFYQTLLGKEHPKTLGLRDYIRNCKSHLH